jgi:NAD(P) transhydrogenase subunit alpha
MSIGLTIAVARRSGPGGEGRVPLVPETVARYVMVGALMIAERGLGTGLDLDDAAFGNVESGARESVLERADVLLCIGPPPVACPAA